MRSDNSSSLVPVALRPVPLQARSDLVVERVRYQGVEHWIVKDPLALRYYRLHAEQYAVLRLLDGKRSLEKIRAELQRAFPTVRPSLSSLQQLIFDFHHKGIAYSHRPGQGAALRRQRIQQRRKRILAGLRNILYIRLPGWDPESTLRRLYPFVRWMFRPWAVVLALLLVLSSWCWLLVQFGEVQRRLPEFAQFFSWPNLLYLWLTLGAAKIVHELAHGFACRHYGGECHEIGVAFLVFSPCLYCDVSDSWVLQSKWKRIWIASAGMCIEVVLSSLAIFAWWFTQPGLLHHLCLNVFFVTAVTTVIFNANPLLRFDGYYILADWLEIPNLRAKADRLLHQGFARWCLGILLPPPPFMPTQRRGWLVLYSLAAAVYRWFMLFGIIFLLHQLLDPYGLASIATGIAIFSVCSILGSMLYSLYQMFSAPRTEPMNYRRLAVSASLAVALLTAGLLIPFPLYVECPFVVEPSGIQHVYTTTPGRLTAVYARPGQRVTRGQLLAQLTSVPELLQYDKLKTDCKLQEIEVDKHRSLGDAGAEKLAEKSLRSLVQRLKDQEERLRRLSIVAPCDGSLVAAEKIPPPDLKTLRTRLASWHGAPLDAKNLGCYLDAGAHLLSVAPTRGYEATLFIDQYDRNDLAVGHKVRLKFSHLVDRTVSGRIESISHREIAQVPKVLSNKYGGALPTLTDQHGQERLTSVAYQAKVTIQNDVHLLKPGLHGRARAIIATRTAGGWIWRILCRTFHFRL